MLALRMCKNKKRTMQQHGEMFLGLMWDDFWDYNAWQTRRNLEYPHG